MLSKLHLSTPLEMEYWALLRLLPLHELAQVRPKQLQLEVHYLGVLQGLYKKNRLLHFCLMTVPRLLRGATVLGVGNIHVLRKEATSPAGHTDDTMYVCIIAFSCLSIRILTMLPNFFRRQEDDSYPTLVSFCRLNRTTAMVVQPMLRIVSLVL